MCEVRSKPGSENPEVITTMPRSRRDEGPFGGQAEQPEKQRETMKECSTEAEGNAKEERTACRPTPQSLPLQCLCTFPAQTETVL